MNPYPVVNVQEWCGQDDVLDTGIWQKPMGLYWNGEEAQAVAESATPRGASPSHDRRF